jgi:hypothetical protein
MGRAALMRAIHFIQMPVAPGADEKSVSGPVPLANQTPSRGVAVSCWRVSVGFCCTRLKHDARDISAIVHHGVFPLLLSFTGECQRLATEEFQPAGIALRL